MHTSSFVQKGFSVAPISPETLQAFAPGGF
jgi:hypothetical protein